MLFLCFICLFCRKEYGGVGWFGYRESGLNRCEYSFCVRNRMEWSCGGDKNGLLMSFR